MEWGRMHAQFPCKIAKKKHSKLFGGTFPRPVRQTFSCPLFRISCIKSHCSFLPGRWVGVRTEPCEL